MPTINPFNDVESQSLPYPTGIAGQSDLRSIAALEVGTGARSFKGDGSGIWMGANKFEDAPFKVNMQGQLIASGTNGAITVNNVDGRIEFYDAAGIMIGVIGYAQGLF